MSEGLFEAVPVMIEAGDRVIAHTIWGDETGTVVDIQLVEGLRFARVRTEQGDILMSLPRLTKLP